MVGILAIQGSVAEHTQVLEQLGVEFVLVRCVEDLRGVSHLIVPGGESTTLAKLLKMYGLWERIGERAKKGDLKIFGTCAGAILCTEWGLSATVDRNAWGRQVDSFADELKSAQFPDLRGVFIRAPRFADVGSATVLATYENEPVLVQEGNLLAATFHPEIVGETRIHEYFLNL